MLRRDHERLMQVYERADVMPLGSGALAGVTYPIDRESVARDLGFRTISRNSMDAIADRDFVLDALYALSVIQMHVSRLCEELVLWSTGEYRFVEIADAFSTGSSIMPQKKNADVAELSRGRSGRVFGNLLGTLTMLKGLPLTYNSDMQEDKEALFEAVDTVDGVLVVVRGMVATLKANRERMAEAAIGDFSLATDAADLLARHGVPFREAHEVVGRLVRSCIDQGKTFADLTDVEWAALHPVFASQRPPLTAMESIDARDAPGGTATGRVMTALEEAETGIGELRSGIDALQQALDAVMRRNSTGLEES
jgi:argininosuccinate lyase